MKIALPNETPQTTMWQANTSQQGLPDGIHYNWSISCLKNLNVHQQSAFLNMIYNTNGHRHHTEETATWHAVLYTYKNNEWSHGSMHEQ